MCGALASLRKICQLYLYPQEIRLVSVVDKNSTQLWSVHPVDCIFDDYIVESAEENCVIMELNIDSLYRAIRSYDLSARGMGGIHIKLAKKDRIPMLRVSFEQNAYSSSETTLVKHEFPVRLIRKDDEGSRAIREPQCPVPNVYLELPSPLKEINKLLDKFKGLGTYITIRVNAKGHISFEIEGDSLRIETTFKNGTIVEIEDGEPGPGLSQQQTLEGDPKVTVNVKDLSNVLQIINVVKRIVIGICNDYAIIYYCYIDREIEVEEGREEVLTYYMSHIDV